MADEIGRRELLRLAGVMGLGAFSMSLTPQALAAVRAKHLVAKHLARKSGGGKNALGTTTGKHAVVKHVVVLDAGHGGCDPGCIGCSGVYEKHVTIETVREIARQLAATGEFRPVLTRNRDVFIPLHERVALARAARGDLFLSVHADAIPDHNVRGASVFTLSDHATDKAAALLAQKENHADVVGGVNLASQNKEVGSILLDLAKRQTANLSIGLAKELVGKLSTNKVRMLEHSHRSAGFAVLRAPDIPSALVELGCLSNKQEDKLLRTTNYQKKLATSIVQSVQAYYSQVVQV